MTTLKAERRNMSTKAKKLRREGYVTGCLFGRELNESIPLQMTKRDVEQLLKTEGKGGRISLHVEGATYDALIKEVDYNALKRQVDEIDFQALVSTEKVHSTAEIHMVNEGKIAGGIAQQVIHEINFKALPASLVEKIELDVGNLKVGDTLRVRDLDISKDPNIDVLEDPESTVVTVSESRISSSEEEEENTEE